MAQGWLVYRLSHSGYWLGLIGFFGQAPAFLVAPLAGAVADHFDRRKILIWVQVAEMLQAFILAALVFSGKIELGHLLCLSIVLGVVSAFDGTTRHAFAVDMVGKGELASAIALNSVLINLARVVGPVIAGVTLTAVGEGWCFTLNGISYLPVIWGLATMKVHKRARPPGGMRVFTHIAEGMRYARRHVVIFRILVLSTFICLIACPYNVLLPAFAKDVFQGNANTLAWLTGMLGLGAVTAAMLFHGSDDHQQIKRKLIADVIFWGLALLTLGLSKNLWLSLGAMFTIGYFMMSVFPAMNNAIQHMVDDSMRGRVMSLYTMTFLGTMPLGCLAMGWLADRYTAPKTVAGAGALTLLMGFALVARNAIRHQLAPVNELISARLKS
ncbi:MAG: MFS transporter [Deltaproteobacteria bacterium]|nr:MFS transporter [Deltaproteobacteria bacterium]